jgi:hypothetical protein
LIIQILVSLLCQSDSWCLDYPIVLAWAEDPMLLPSFGALGHPGQSTAATLSLFWSIALPFGHLRDQNFDFPTAI